MNSGLVVVGRVIGLKILKVFNIGVVCVKCLFRFFFSVKVQFWYRLVNIFFCDEGRVSFKFLYWFIKVFFKVCSGLQLDRILVIFFFVDFSDGLMVEQWILFCWNILFKVLRWGRISFKMRRVLINLILFIFFSKLLVVVLCFLNFLSVCISVIKFV